MQTNSMEKSRLRQWGVRVVALALLVMAVCWLATDVPLDPAVHDWIAQSEPAPLTADNGYPLLMGLATAEDADAQAAGLAQLQALHDAGNAPDASLPLLTAAQPNPVKAYPLPKDPLFCKLSDAVCLTRLFAATAGQRGVLIKQHRVLLQRYEALMGHAQIRSLAPASANEILPAFEYLPVSAQLLRLALLDDLQRKQQASVAGRLLLDVRQLRTHLAQADQLVHKMILVRLISDQLLFMQGLQAQGRVVFPADELMASLMPLTQDERDLSAAMRRELAMQAALLFSMEGNPQFSDMAKAVPGWMVQMVFKPNMSLNRSYPHYRHISELSRLPQAEYLSRRQQPLPTAEPDWLRNPAGSVLVRVGIPDFLPYIDRLHALDERLAALRVSLAGQP